MQYALNYSGTRFLSTENQNFLMSWWIPFSYIFGYKYLADETKPKIKQQQNYNTYAYDNNQINNTFIH